MARDPVCGMEVDEKTEFRSEYNGKVYYFCSQHCKNEFDENPQKYVKEKRSRGC